VSDDEVAQMTAGIGDLAAPDGCIELGQLKPAEWREVTRDEIAPRNTRDKERKRRT